MNFDLQHQMRAWERHAAFRKWQDAITMRILFGNKHLAKIPPLPKEYKDYATKWLTRELPEATSQQVEAMISDTPKA